MNNLVYRKAIESGNSLNIAFYIGGWMYMNSKLASVTLSAPSQKTSLAVFIIRNKLAANVCNCLVESAIRLYSSPHYMWFESSYV